MKKSQLVDIFVFGTEDQRTTWLRARRESGVDLPCDEIERALVDLATLTRSLIERMEAAGLVRRDELRVEEPQPIHGYRGENHEVLVNCVDCRARIKLQDSYETASGTVCTQCHERRVRREEEQERERRES